MIITELHFYSTVMLIAVIHFIYIQLCLGRGLEQQFIVVKATKQINDIMELSQKAYIFRIIHCSISICLIILCAYKLLENLNIVNFYTILILCGFAIIYGRERLYYTTALFVALRCQQ